MRPEEPERQVTDAVIVVPGIMGSTLKVGRQTIWGFNSLDWYFKAWKEHRFANLKLTPAEQDGEFGRVSATSLISTSAFIPKIDLVNPYHKLVQALKDNSVHKDAVEAFPYDWRLPVQHNGRKLAKFAESHLRSWKQHPALKAFRSQYPDTPTPGIILVAHSMGGLVSLEAARKVHVDRIIALGTPWLGSTRPLLALASGLLGGLPLSNRAVQDLSANLPAIHDLLPMYDCRAPQLLSGEPTCITPSFVESLGGSAELARSSIDAYRGRKEELATSVHDVIGFAQPTPASVKMRRGQLEASPLHYRRAKGVYSRDKLGNLVTYAPGGDGTVLSFSAAPPRHVSRSQQYLQHNQLSLAEEAILLSVHLASTAEGDVQTLGGDREGIGIDLPDLIRRGSRATVTVTGIESGTEATVSIAHAAGGIPTERRLRREEGQWQAVLETDIEGIFTVTVRAGTGSSLRRSYMCIEE